MKEFLKKYKWWIINFIAVNLLIPFLYVYFDPFTPKPRIKFYLDKPYTIATTNKGADSLSINYKGQNLEKDSMNLILTTIRIANTSRAIIKKDNYLDEPFGIKIADCKIVGVKISDGEKDI